MTGFVVAADATSWPNEGVVLLIIVLVIAVAVIWLVNRNSTAGAPDDMLYQTPSPADEANSPALLAQETESSDRPEVYTI